MVLQQGTSTDYDSVKVDPEFEKALPAPLNDLEFEARIKESKGNREAAELLRDSNVIFDGHRRFRSCKKLGLPYKYKYSNLPYKYPEDKDRILDEIYKRQIHDRRNLTPIQSSFTGYTECRERWKRDAQRKKEHPKDYP